jgi:amino acid transporter
MEMGSSWSISANKTSHKKTWIDGFRRAEPRPGYLPTDAPERYYDLRAANAKTANTALARELKGRHLQMIAFGGAIGKRLSLFSHLSR